MKEVFNRSFWNCAFFFFFGRLQSIYRASFIGNSLRHISILEAQAKYLDASQDTGWVLKKCFKSRYAVKTVVNKRLHKLKDIGRFWIYCLRTWYHIYVTIGLHIPFHIYELWKIVLLNALQGQLIFLVVMFRISFMLQTIANIQHLYTTSLHFYNKHNVLRYSTFSSWQYGKL